MELIVLPRVGFFGAALLSGFSGFSGGLITSNAVIAYSVSNGTRGTGSGLHACFFTILVIFTSCCGWLKGDGMKYGLHYRPRLMYVAYHGTE